MSGDDPAMVPDHWLRAMLETPLYPGSVIRRARDEAGLSQWRPGDPVTYHDEARLLDALVHASGDPLAGARIGLDHDPRGGSVLTYICLCCPTLEDLFVAAARYVAVTRQLSRIEMRPVQGGTSFEFSTSDPRVSFHMQHAEFALAATTRVLRFATQTERLPDRILFAHARGETGRALSTLFGCALEFGSERHAIELTRAQLKLSLRTGDLVLQGHLTAYADLLLAERKAVSPQFRHAIEASVLSHLPRGTATAERIAAEVGMSPRSLRRRLAEEDLTFRGLVDDLRQMLSAAYLDDPSLTLSEIALLLGFADHSAFTTAYRRWHGVPPSAARTRRAFADRS